LEENKQNQTFDYDEKAAIEKKIKYKFGDKTRGMLRKIKERK
jgi:hypothetical protein